MRESGSSVSPQHHYGNFTRVKTLVFVFYCSVNFYTLQLCKLLILYQMPQIFYRLSYSIAKSLTVLVQGMPLEGCWCPNQTKSRGPQRVSALGPDKTLPSILGRAEGLQSWRTLYWGLLRSNPWRRPWRRCPRYRQSWTGPRGWCHRCRTCCRSSSSTLESIAHEWDEDYIWRILMKSFNSKFDF